jgi:hypothetical protein
VRQTGVLDPGAEAHGIGRAVGRALRIDRDLNGMLRVERLLGQLDPR